MTSTSDVRDDTLQAIVDRQGITDCLLRYTRGADRVDAELIRSAFHSDAIDHHGPVEGTVEDFLAYWLPLQGPREASSHYISNVAIDLDGDTAHVETYFIHFQKLTDEPELLLRGGRYVDRFERRDIGWRIALRFVIPEWTMTADGSKTTERIAAHPRGRPDRSDPVYMRPLTGPPVEF